MIIYICICLCVCIIWSNYSDLTRPGAPRGSWGREIPEKISEIFYNLARYLYHTNFTPNITTPLSETGGWRKESRKVEIRSLPTPWKSKSNFSRILIDSKELQNLLVTSPMYVISDISSIQVRSNSEFYPLFFWMKNPGVCLTCQPFVGITDRSHGESEKAFPLLGT